MKPFKKTFLLLFLSGLSFSISAQYKHTAMFGIKAGVSYSAMSDLSAILVSEGYYSNYNFSDASMVAPSASLFFHYRPTKICLGMEADVVYYQQGSSITYTDINTLEYTVDFRYHYAGFGVYLKVYPVAGLHLDLGGRVGFCLTPEHITYTSNQEDEIFNRFHYETVEATQTALRDKLKGKTDIGIGGSLGYEFPAGVSLQLAYHYSVLDLIRTEYNLYNWTETPNHAHQIQFSVGYAFKASRR